MADDPPTAESVLSGAVKSDLLRSVSENKHLVRINVKLHSVCVKLDAEGIKGFPSLRYLRHALEDKINHLM